MLKCKSFSLVTALSASYTCAHADYTRTSSTHTHNLSSLSPASSYPDCQGVIIAKCQVLGGGSEELKAVVEDYKEVSLEEENDLDYLAGVSSFFDNFLKRFSQRLAGALKTLFNFV